MTGTQQRPAHLGGWTPGQLCFGFFALFCLLLILRNPDTAIEYMTSGLRLCARTVIPSLFPFLVLSELIVSGGIGRILLRPVSGMLSRLFRLIGVPGKHLKKIHLSR